MFPILILYFSSFYLILGAVFALIFLTKMVHKIDRRVQASGIGFRLLLVPATILLWPYLLTQLIKGKL